MKNLIFFFAFTLSFASLAQNVDEYAVTIQGDTLRGPIKMTTSDEIFDRVQIVIDGKKKNFTSQQIKSLHIKGITYNAIRQNNTLHYMKLMIRGFLSLYGFKAPNQTGYDGLFLVKRGGESMEVPNAIGFKKLMSQITSECVSVSEDIKNEKLKRTDLYSIVDKFNECIDAKKRSIIDTSSHGSSVDAKSN